MVMFLLRSALVTAVKSTTAKGVRAIWNTLVPRLATFCSTYRLAPCTMVMTVMSVATPMVRPSTVSAARSLWTRIDSPAMARFSVSVGILSDGDPAPLLADLDGVDGAGAQRKLRLQLLLPVDDDGAGFALASRVADRLGQADPRQQLVNRNEAVHPR